MQRMLSLSNLPGTNEQQPEPEELKFYTDGMFPWANFEDT